jgi:hypothetical protein
MQRSPGPVRKELRLQKCAEGMRHRWKPRIATPPEIAAFDPAPDPRHFVYVVKCRHLPLMTAVFDGDVSPLPGEFDDDDVARELWQGVLALDGLF